MINELKIVAVIPAKGSSERVQNKNLRLVDGEPLVLRAVRKCVQSKFFDEVWIDTESQEIIMEAIDSKILNGASIIFTSHDQNINNSVELNLNDYKS